VALDFANLGMSIRNKGTKAGPSSSIDEIPVDPDTEPSTEEFPPLAGPDEDRPTMPDGFETDVFGLFGASQPSIPTVTVSSNAVLSCNTAMKSGWYCTCYTELSSWPKLKA
jgi:hypothetical protein